MICEVISLTNEFSFFFLCGMGKNRFAIVKIFCISECVIRDIVRDSKGGQLSHESVAQFDSFGVFYRSVSQSITLLARIYT